MTRYQKYVKGSDLQSGATRDHLQKLDVAAARHRDITAWVEEREDGGGGMLTLSDLILTGSLHENCSTRQMTVISL